MVNYILFFSLGYSELIERLAIFSLIYENHFGHQSSSVTTYLNPLRSSDSTYSSTLTSQQSYGIFVSNQICSLCSDWVLLSFENFTKESERNYSFVKLTPEDYSLQIWLMMFYKFQNILSFLNILNKSLRFVCYNRPHHEKLKIIDKMEQFPLEQTHSVPDSIQSLFILNELIFRIFRV
jgi:hypothetical protein